MRLGLFRTSDAYLGECACVDPDAGDAFPFLIRELYELLLFEPDFDSLPTKEAFEAKNLRRLVLV